MTRTTAAPLLVLALLLGASGCGGDTKTPASSSATPEPAASDPAGPTDDESGSSDDAVPFPADTAADDGGLGSGNGLGLTGVRVARQDGYDRVVFDLGGKGKPGWHVEYVDQPTADGSGDPVDLDGDVYLQVVLHGLGLPDDTGVPAYGDFRTRVPGTGTRGVAQVAPGSVFEGDQQAFIGLTGEQRPFRVFALTNPTRVVVDVRDR